MKKVIALANQKGGVGKTTSAVNIAAGLNRSGKTTLLVDMDPQANLTYSLGVKAHELEKTVFDLLKGNIAFKEVIKIGEGFVLVPANIDLAGAELELSGLPGREFLLREALNGIDVYDYILIDCPPSLGLLTLNALVAANEVYIPLQAEFLPVQGLTQLFKTVDLVKKRLNKGLEITGLLVTFYDGRKKLNQQGIEKIKESAGDILFNTAIRNNVSLAEAPGVGKDIFQYRPDSHGAVDYMSLCQEILTRG